MSDKGQSSFNGTNANDIVINIDLDVLAKRLAADPDFIKSISNKVRVDLTKHARNMGNLFGKWAGR